MAIQIDPREISRYTDYLVMTEPASQADPMADMSVFDGAVDTMAALAERDGETDTLRMVLDSVIANPEDRIDELSGPLFPYSESELVQIFTYAFERAYPDEVLSDPDEAIAIEFVRGAGTG